MTRQILSSAYLRQLIRCAFCAAVCSVPTSQVIGQVGQPAKELALPSSPSKSSPDDGTAKTAPANLSEDEVRAIVAEYLKEKEAAKAASEKPLTDKEKNEQDLAMSARWNNGLEVSTKDKKFRIHVGGRHQLDSAWLNAPANVQQNINQPYRDGVDFRRSRMRMDLTLYEVHEFCAEFDFVNSVRVRNQPPGFGGLDFIDQTVTAPTDLWYQINELPLFGHMRIGNQKEQVGFEHIVSSRFQPFMERSYNQDTFYGGNFNGFQPGITLFDTYADEMGVWNIGAFKPTNNLFAASTGNGDYALSARITRLLLWENDGERLIHLGLSGRQGTAVTQPGVPGRVVSYRTRDAIRSGLSANWSVPASINLFGEATQTLNAEFVAVNGPWTWQSEYLVNTLDNARTNFADNGTYVKYHGGYMQLLYFLTGEHDHYSRKTGAFERVTPRNNFFTPCGCNGWRGLGAWQAGFRYNYLDLNDQGLNGGLLHSYVAGLNWFWNPNMKLQFDYMVTHRDMSDVAGREAGTGTIHGFGTRLAIDF